MTVDVISLDCEAVKQWQVASGASDRKREPSSALKVPQASLTGSHRGLQSDRDHLPSSCILLPQKQCFITETSLPNSCSTAKRCSKKMCPQRFPSHPTIQPAPSIPLIGPRHFCLYMYLRDGNLRIATVQLV